MAKKADSNKKVNLDPKKVEAAKASIDETTAAVAAAGNEDQPKPDEPYASPTDVTELSLNEKILAITSEVGKIEKTGKNQQQGYEFIEQAAIITHLRGYLVYYGVQITPEMVELIMHKKDKGAKMLVKFIMHVINVHKPEEHQEIGWYGEGDDSLDKGTNKAATAAEKYFLMKLFKISDRDDPDGDGPGAKNNNRPANTPQAPGQKVLPPRPANEKIDDQERTILANHMIRVGFETKEEQLALLKSNGVTNPQEMTSGMARSMIKKLSTNAFTAPVHQVGEDTTSPPADDTSPADPPAAAPPAASLPIDEPELVVDDDLKGYVENMLENLGLNTFGKQWFMKSISGRPFAKTESLTDSEWRKAYEMIQGIDDLSVEVEDKYILGASTPQSPTGAPPRDFSVPTSQQADDTTITEPEPTA